MTLLQNRSAALTIEEPHVDQWHDAMSRFLDIHYEQTALYSDGHGKEQHSRLLLRNGSDVIAGAQVGVMRLPVIGRGLAFLRFGPFWRDGAAAPVNRYRDVMQTLVHRLCQQQKNYLVVRPRAHPDIYPREAAVLKSLGFTESTATTLDRYIVDASLRAEDQMKSFDQGWRAKLRKAMKSGVELRLANHAAGVETFQQMYGAMVDRKHLNYEGVDRVDALRSMMALQGMQSQIALAYFNGKPIAGATFAILGDVAYYVFGATTAEALPLHAGYLLQWFILEQIRESGARWYELGGPGDPGIRQFKKGLTGKSGMLLAIREFHYSPDAITTAVVAGLYKARDVRNAFQLWQRSRA